MKEEKIRKLVIKAFHIEKVSLGEKTAIENGILSISTKKIQRAAKNTDLISSLSVNVIQPDNRNQFVNTIMDILPISCKVLGKIGEGITHTLTGVYAMICARDESGRQMAAFGSSEGILQDQIQWGRLVKLIAGQGACYDNRLFPNEPSGFEGGKSIIDMGNMPVVLTPNEYRDGAIRALT